MLSLLVTGLLFFILSPGILLTIPARSRGLFLSGQTSIEAAAVHAVVFMGVLYLLMSVVEGFGPIAPLGPRRPLEGKKPLRTTNCCSGAPNGTNACKAGCVTTGTCMNGRLIPSNPGGLCQ
jgi:hypothetical protein